jgi:hypothetical protein
MFSVCIFLSGENNFTIVFFLLLNIACIICMSGNFLVFLSNIWYTFSPMGSSMEAVKCTLWLG